MSKELNMKKLILFLVLICALSVFSETLFEVKDASNRKVLDVSTDGLRILNNGDTLMVISPAGVRVNLDNSANKALSRTFAVTTTASKNKGLNRVLEVGTESTTMREGDEGQRYTDFSPKNIFLGLNAGLNTSPWTMEPTFYGTRNTFLGNYAGYSNTSGFGNIYIGYEAGYNCTTSNQNIYIGYNAGYSTFGQSNTIVGYLAGKGNGNGGDYNSFFGRAAGFSIGIAGDNTLLGGGSGSALVNGYSNTLVGKDAGKGLSAAAFSNNTVLGASAGTQLSTGGNNLILGYNSGASLSTGSGNVLIGYQSGSLETGSNKLYIDNSNTATPLLYGDFTNDVLTVNGTLYSTGNLSAGGTYFRVNTNPGTAASPVSYVYQGGSVGSTTKEFAFAVNDALWVTSHSWFDGYITAPEVYSTGVGATYRDLYIDSTGKLGYLASSNRYKKNVTDMDDVSWIFKLRPVNYSYKSDVKNKKEYGLIAEEVEKINPSFVSYNEDDSVETVNYSTLITPMLKAIQDQQGLIEELRKEIELLKNK
jgi:hypothetical protein